MKATLEFTLPEEQIEHQDAVNGTDWRLVVANLDNLLRNAMKHDHNLPSADAAFRMVRERLIEELEERNLSL